MSIPLIYVDREDQLVWHCTKNSIFTVKSVYHFHKDMLARNVGETSQHLDWLDVWKSIWSLKALNEVRIFI